MTAKKLWKVTRPEPWAESYRPESKVAAYRYIQSEAANWQCSPDPNSSTRTVWVDERDGQGWQPYERIDLNEMS